MAVGVLGVEGHGGAGATGEEDPLGAARQWEQEAAERPARALELLERAGWLYFDAGAYGDAGRVFEAMVGRAPRFGNALDGMCATLYAAGDLDTLQAALSRRLPATEQPAAAALMAAGIGAPEGSFSREWSRAWLYVRFGGANPRALEPLARTLAVVPDHAEARWRLAELYRRLDRKEDASAAEAEFADRHPGSAEAYAVRAAQRASASVADALLEIDAGLRRFPGAALLYTRGAVLARGTADPVEGADYISGLVDRAEQQGLTGTASLVARQLAEHCVGHRLYREAEAVYRELLAPGSPGADWEKAGLVCLAQGKWADGAEAWAQAAASHAADPLSKAGHVRGARAWEALALLATGEPAATDRARVGLARALAVVPDPSEGRAVELRAFAVWAGVCDREAGLTYRPGDQRGLPVRAGLKRRAQGHSALSLPEEARRRVLLDIVRAHPGCYPAHYALAHGFALSGDTEAVRAHLEAARTTCAGWWATHWSLGLYYLDAGDRKAATAALQAALRLAPGLTEAGVLLTSLGGR